MKRNAWIGTMALMFALGVAVPAYAQEAGHEDAKPAESKPAEEKPAEAKPAPKPAAKPVTHATAKPATHTVNKPQEAKPEEPKQDAKSAEHAENKPAPKPEAKPAPKSKPAPAHNDAAHNDAARNDAEHRDAAKPAARENTHATQRNVSQQKNDAHRIPEDKYRANFGREHTFHVGHPVNEGGRYRFAYGGYNFYYAQAWPAGWGYDDEVYVVEIDGVYYLEDVVHPGVQLALTIDL